jgi:hypothetical protein
MWKKAAQNVTQLERIKYNAVKSSVTNTKVMFTSALLLLRIASEYGKRDN